jgi:hypothetical protein
LPDGAIRLNWRAPVEMDDALFSVHPVDAIPLDVAVRRAIKALGFANANTNQVATHVGKRKEEVLTNLRTQKHKDGLRSRLVMAHGASSTASKGAASTFRRIGTPVTARKVGHLIAVQCTLVSNRC